MNKLLLLCALLLSTVLPSLAHAADCTEITAPSSIAAAGHFCLGANLVVNSVSGSAVAINASDVDLDCRGYAIANLATTPTGNAYGVYINNRHNVRVHGCRISGGFAAGIYAYQDNGLANQNTNLEFTGNSVAGTYWYGILAYGTAISIRDNRIHGIGGRDSFAMGIRLGGSNLAGEPRFFVVDGNDLSGVDSPNNNAYAIYANNSEGSAFTHNTIYGTRVHNGSFDGYGIYLFATGSSNNRITDNTITGTTAGSDIGIFGSASDSCFDNLIRAMSTSVLTCDATHGNY